MHTALHRLATGTELYLTLAEGSELFCRQGRLRISTAQQGWTDGVAPAAIVLGTGQGWRAACGQQLRVTALDPACLALTRPREAAAGPAPRGEGLLAGWLRVLRRRLRAA